jgi:hypothetical protein
MHFFVPREAALPLARASFGEGLFDVLASFAAGQVGFEPAPQLRAKSFIVCAELEIHSVYPTNSAINARF